jgi:hypothetical protein
MEALVEAAKLWPNKIVLSDGSLIPWAGIKKDMDQQSDSYLKARRKANGKMIAGVISSPKSKYITNLLNIVMGNTQANSKRGLIGDKELFKRTLKQGQRSAMFVHGSPLNDITANDAVYLFYLKISEEEVVRVEIPAWIANNPDSVDMVHASILKDSYGLDYPFHLFQAHDQCKIPSSVAQAIQNEAISQYVARTGHYPYLSAKERLKNA